jgi:hypothetical protein
MTDEKKLTDDELESASGAGPTISGQQTSNREPYGTGQVEEGEGRSSGEIEPHPLGDAQLGQVKGGVASTSGGSSGISSQKLGAREPLSEESVEGGRSDTTRKDG